MIGPHHRPRDSGPRTLEDGVILVSSHRSPAFVLWEDRDVNMRHKVDSELPLRRTRVDSST
jgi:hypothetical protein